MSSSSVTTPVAVAEPRRAVIDRSWRAIGPGVEVFSGADGAPLRRTVKRILDPLVLRLRVNPRYSAPLLDPDVAAALTEVIIDHAPQLRAAAAWFAVLKAHRRRSRITSGNAQELYFPICFELAVTNGVPSERDSLDEFVATVLREVHGERDRTAIEVLNRYVDDDHVVRALRRQLERSWADVRPGGAITAPFFAGLTTVLGDADGHTAAAARQRVWDVLVADATPFDLGARARTEPSALPWSLTDLGLTAREPQQPPAVETRADRSRPLDRSVVDRVRATLRRGLDRDELPDVPALCAEEIDRACAPWGLLSEDGQAVLLAGIEIAVDLAPLSDATPGRYDLGRTIQARLRKEAYVLHARRYLADGGPLHPRQRQVVDDLAGFARPYLSRLWARLHGRDVWQEPCTDVDDVRAVLEGVARSVSLDHRQRIKAMLDEAVTS
nr:hypothetical protein [Mycolicibacterium grossiae]